MAFNGSDDGLGSDERKCAPRHQHRHSIILNNPLAMRRKAYRFVYGFKVPVRLMDVMDMFVHGECMDGDAPCAGNFNTRVMETCEITLPPARLAIKDCVKYKKMLSVRRDGARRIFFMTPQQYDLLNRVIEFQAKIPEVVMLQMQSPNDPTAGSKLLPPEVYHNVVATYIEAENDGEQK